MTALLLLLCAATVALWVRSYFVQDYVEALENYRGSSAKAGKFEFRNYRSTWDSTYGRIRFSSADHLVGTNTEAEAARARWRATRQVSRGHITPQHSDNNKWVKTGPEEFWNRQGFFAWRGQDTSGRTKFIVYGIPYWAPALAFALGPTAWVLGAAWRRHRRGQRGCPACGYDLRATPDRCPECGTIPAR